ncbi:MAG: SRPBCC family protein [Pseudomonadales bacterium]|nr:SRPBCC family protein [Pseudomonadales bacterium]
MHYVFPNVSISDGHGDTIQLSRLFPEPDVHRSTTVQHHYFRQPVIGDMVSAAENKRQVYERVMRDEDRATVFGISEVLPAMGASLVEFARNEPANQNLHRYIEDVLGGRNDQ